MANTKIPQGPGTFVTQAYSQKDDKGVQKFYKKWAHDYDNQMQKNLGYTSPETIAQLLSKYLDNKEAYSKLCKTAYLLALRSQIKR